jgi:hypothetical protein
VIWFRRSKKKERERAEAESALQESRQKSAQIKRREEESKGLFARIHELRRENHIAEAVGRIMEGR